MEIKDVIRKSYLSNNLTDEEVDSLARIGSIIEVEQGKEVFKEDEPGDSLYIIESGNVRIFKPILASYEETLAILGPGVVFGEMSFIDRVTRSATAQAITHSKLVRISRVDFERLTEGTPGLAMKVMAELARMISNRIRTSNNKLRECLNWIKEITGLGGLGLKGYQDTKGWVRIFFPQGSSLTGQLIVASQGESGYELTLKDADGRIYLIPYHSVSYIILGSEPPRDIGSL